MCGIIGIYNLSDASILAYQGLYSLQHRGQESAGIVSSDGSKVYKHTGMGLVQDIFSDIHIFNKQLPGHIAIGHNRYSTTGDSSSKNIQPLLLPLDTGYKNIISVAHNGNFTNTEKLRTELKDVNFLTNSDTEVFLQLLRLSEKKTFVEKIQESLNKIEGAYSIVMTYKNHLIGVRDPGGWRPLCLGKKDNGYILTSETCALDLIGAEYIRDILPGEIIVIRENNKDSFQYWSKQFQRKSCIFELVYFARPDSKVFNENVDVVRRNLGKNLAIEHPIDGDIVIPVPDSSNTIALGYAHQSGIKYEIGLIRNHYVGRTFIHPDQKERDFNVRVKFNVIENSIKGKRVVIVDDSIVRGTTLKQLTKMLKKAGAKEIHIRIGSPPIISPCYYGMDFPTWKELIASEKSVEEIRTFLGVDSLAYLSLEGMMKSVSGSGFCNSCFTGKYI